MIYINHKLDIQIFIKKKKVRYPNGLQNCEKNAWIIKNDTILCHISPYDKLWFVKVCSQITHKYTFTNHKYNKLWYKIVVLSRLEIVYASQSERSYNLLPCPTYQDNKKSTLSLTCHHSIIFLSLSKFFFSFFCDSQNFPFTLLSLLIEIFVFIIFKQEQHFPSFSCWTNKGWDWLAILSLLSIWFFFVGYSLSSMRTKYSLRYLMPVAVDARFRYCKSQ